MWAALTDPVQLREWAPFDADRDLGRVGDATLTMVDRDIRQDLPAAVTRAERPTLLEYTWGDDRSLRPPPPLRSSRVARPLGRAVNANWLLCESRFTSPARAG